jgi:hypothetical protein
MSSLQDCLYPYLAAQNNAPVCPEIIYGADSDSS